MPPTARWPTEPSSAPSPDQVTHTIETVAEVEHSRSIPSPPHPHTHLPSREEGQADISSIVSPRDGQTPIPIPDIDPPDGVQTVEVEVKAPTGSEPSTPLGEPPSEPQEPLPPSEQQESHPPSEQQEPLPPSELQEPHEEEREETPPPKPKPQQEASTVDTPTNQDGDQPTANAGGSQSDSHSLDLGPEPQVLRDACPHPPPPPHSTSSLPSLASRGRGIGVTFDPHLSGPPPHGSREGPQKTVAKGKQGLSMTDLFPMNYDVGHRMKQLAEPSTPEFKPTPDWVCSWKQKLPLNTILRVLQLLVPQVEKLCTDQNVKTEHEILKYLKNGTLVGLLPVPHPILIRKYQTSRSTELWFHTYIWGVVYVRNFDPPIWYDTEVRLFQVNKQF